MNDDRRKTIADAAEAMLAIIMRKREAYVSAWIAETGAKPSECELVETRGLDADGNATFTVRVQRIVAPLATPATSAFKCPACNAWGFVPGGAG